MRTIWNMLRYGEWGCGCKFYKGKPMFGLYTGYYDGNHACFHLGPLWISVAYW